MNDTLERWFADPQLRLGLLTLVVLLAQAVIATNLLEVELDWVSEFAPLLVYALFVGTRWRSLRAEAAFGAAIVVVSTVVLLLYARL